MKVSALLKILTLVCTSIFSLVCSLASSGCSKASLRNHPALQLMHKMTSLLPTPIIIEFRFLTRKEGSSFNLENVGKGNSRFKIISCVSFNCSTAAFNNEPISLSGMVNFFILIELLQFVQVAIL